MSVQEIQPSPPVFSALDILSRGQNAERVYQAGLLQKQEGSIDRGTVSDGIWIDMVAPSQQEELAVEGILKVEIPTPAEMREVESSSQIYREGEATVMTIRVMSVTSSPSPTLMAATFILTPARLVTLRYADPTPFRVFIDRLRQEPERLESPRTVMIGLLEAIVDRAADILENSGARLWSFRKEPVRWRCPGKWSSWLALPCLSVLLGLAGMRYAAEQ